MSTWLDTNVPIIGLSPMDGVTDEPFRATQCHIAKPDVVFTEFVSAEGLAHGGVKIFDNLLYSSLERPIIAQLFGKDPDSFYQAATILCFLGFDGIDINMGCPAKTVTQHGSGAALIQKPRLASEIIKAVQSAITDFSSKKTKLDDLKVKDKVSDVIGRNLKYSNYGYSTINHPIPTISVKTRLGIDSSIVDTWIEHLASHHLNLISLHGRTLKQGYSGTADWSQIIRASHVVKQQGIKFFGNGDITSRQQGEALCQQHQLDGVLIGRASLGNPWVFTSITPSYQNRFDAAVYHWQKFIEVFPHRTTESLRRHLLAYTSGLPHAKQLRSQLVCLNTLDQLLSLENEFTPC